MLPITGALQSLPGPPQKPHGGRGRHCRASVDQIDRDVRSVVRGAAPGTILGVLGLELCFRYGWGGAWRLRPWQSFVYPQRPDFAADGSSGGNGLAAPLVGANKLGGKPGRSMGFHTIADRHWHCAKWLAHIPASR
jgi:hypothetical protein